MRAQRGTLFVVAALCACSADTTKDGGDSGVVIETDMHSPDAAVDMQLDLGVVPPVRLSVRPTTLQLNENGGSGSFSVWLRQRPVTRVDVVASSSDEGEATTWPNRPLVFTPDDWDVPQVVEVRGVDDACPDGTMTVTITVGGDGVEPVEVVVDVDDDQPGGGVSRRAVTVMEAALDATVEVFLGIPGEECGIPNQGRVTIPVSVSDPGELSVSTDELVFEVGSERHELEIVAVDDPFLEATEEHTVILGAATGGGFDGIDLPDVAVTIISDDEGQIFRAPATLTTSESGTSATFDVWVEPAPEEFVDVAMTWETSEGDVTPASLTFAPGETGPKTVTVTGVPDDECTGDETYVIDIAVTSSWIFDGFIVPPVVVTNQEIDGYAVNVVPTDLSVLEGDFEGFTVSLSCNPMEIVTVDLTSTNLNDVVLSPASLTFDPTNFQTPQRVTVLADDNAIVDGNRSLTIQTTLNATMGYAGVDPPDVSVLIQDDD